MKKKAQVSDRFRDFDANLTTRPWIVLGMGLRRFEKFFILNTFFDHLRKKMRRQIQFTIL